MDHKMSYRILRIGQFSCLVPLVLAYVLNQDERLATAALVLCILGGVMLFVALILAFFFYRCPRCGCQLPIRTGRPDYCARCGKRIDW